MTEEQKAIVIRAIAAVAWADGNLSEEERSHIAEVVTKIGGYDQSKVEELLATQPDVEKIRDELKNFSRPLVGEILGFCYRMSVADNKIHVKELETIRSLAQSHWDQWDAESVIRWLGKTYEAENLYLRLFVLPEAKNQKAG